MAKTATLSIRIDAETKSQAEKLFAQLGLTTAAAVNLFFRQAINDSALPFRPRLGNIPNAETRAAISEAESEKDLSGPFASVDEMFDALES